MQLPFLSFRPNHPLAKEEKKDEKKETKKRRVLLTLNLLYSLVVPPDVRPSGGVGLTSDA
jgi:hypothetical protein